MPHEMKVGEYARLKSVSRQTVWLWIRKGAVRVSRLAPKTAVRVLVEDADLPRDWRPVGFAARAKEL